MDYKHIVQPSRRGPLWLPLPLPLLTIVFIVLSAIGCLLTFPAYSASFLHPTLSKQYYIQPTRLPFLLLRGTLSHSFLHLGGLMSQRTHYTTLLWRYITQETKRWSRIASFRLCVRRSSSFIRRLLLSQPLHILHLQLRSKS